MRIRVTKRHSALSEALRSQRLNRLGLGLVGVSALVAVAGFPFPETACAAPPLRIAITARFYDYTQAPPTIWPGPNAKLVESSIGPFN